jgi:hypothetical protein
MSWKRSRAAPRATAAQVELHHGETALGSTPRAVAAVRPEMGKTSLSIARHLAETHGAFGRDSSTRSSADGIRQKYARRMTAGSTDMHAARGIGLG